MKFREVEAISHQLTGVVTLNRSYRGKVDFNTLKGGTIIIDSVEDEITKCVLNNCHIISSVPLTIDSCHINPIGDIEQLEKIDVHTPHAIIDSCIFNSCKMPKADYGNNYVMGKPQSSNQR